MNKLKTIFLTNTYVKIKLLLVLLLVVILGVKGQLYPIPSGWIKMDGTEVTKDATVTFPSHNEFVRWKKDEKFQFAKVSNLSDESQAYDALTDFNDGFAVAKVDKDWWVIDTAENKIKKLACHYAYGFHDGLARVQLGNRFGYVNTKGELVVPVKYYGAHDFSEGRARVYINGKWGVINTQGQWVAKPGYDYVTDFSEGKAGVMKENKNQQFWGFINEDGVEVIERKFDFVFPFTEGLAIARVGDYFANQLVIINTKGEEIFKVPFVDIYPFSDGLANFYKDGKWGYINKNFEVVIEAMYDNPVDFKSGLAFVSVNEKSMYIDKTGAVVWQ